MQLNVYTCENRYTVLILTFNTFIQRLFFGLLFETFPISVGKLTGHDAREIILSCLNMQSTVKTIGTDARNAQVCNSLSFRGYMRFQVEHWTFSDNEVDWTIYQGLKYTFNSFKRAAIVWTCANKPQCIFAYKWGSVRAGENRFFIRLRNWLACTIFPPRVSNG